MNITVEVNDELLAKARKYSELQDDAELVHRALKAFVEREAARRLAGMGGCDPNANAAAINQASFRTPPETSE